MTPSAPFSRTTSSLPSRTGRNGAAAKVVTSDTAPDILLSELLARGLRRALLKKILQACFCLWIRLCNRRHKRLHRVSALRIHFGNAWQRMHYGKICEGRIAGNAVADLETLCETFACLHQIGRQADALALLGGIGAA